MACRDAGVQGREARLRELLATRTAVLDGGTGTFFQAQGLGADAFRVRVGGRDLVLEGDFDVLNVTRPDVVRACHREFLERGGADIIETNTFSSTPVAQRHYLKTSSESSDTSLTDEDIEAFVYRMARAGAEIAVAAAREAEAHDPTGRPRFVAGSVGPTGFSLTLHASSSAHLTFDDMVRSYGVQMRALLDAHVDIVLVETVFDTLNCKAALAALHDAATARGLTHPPPVWVSATLGDGGRTLAGQTPAALWCTLAPYAPAVFGLNCSLGPQDTCRAVAAFLRAHGDRAPCCLAVHPNAGGVDGSSSSSAPAAPAAFAAHLEPLVAAGALRIVGGCCGTTAQHTAALAAMVARVGTRPAATSAWGAAPGLSPQPPLALCGTDVVCTGARCLVAGERCSVPGSRAFREAVGAGDWERARAVAHEQVTGQQQGQGPCDMLDVCMDDAMVDGAAAMEAFLGACAGDREVARVPLVVDSSCMATVAAALARIPGRALVNSVSLRDGEDALVRGVCVCRRFGAAAVVMACDEDGQAVTCEHKLRVCRRAYDILTTRCAMRPEDIVFDLNVMTIGSGVAAHANYAVEFLHALRRVKQELPGGVHTIAGVSNVSFAFRSCVPARRALHTVLLHLTEGLLDIAIVNPNMVQPYDSLPEDLRELCLDLILNRTPNATAALTEYCVHAARNTEPQPQKAAKVACTSPEDRVVNAITQGNTDALRQALQAMLHNCPDPGTKDVWNIVEEPLTRGMKLVGDMLASGELFLPQVLRSAQAVHDSVHDIFHSTSPEGDQGTEIPLVILATVKGDVHDIGKNIVGTVLSSAAGVRILDLGTMCPKERILNAVVEHAKEACAVGLSGLINPSLHEMALVLQELQEHGCTIPVLIGGAATSELHTAVKLAPLYPAGSVIYVHDASTAVPIVRALAGDERTRNTFITENKERQQELLNMQQKKDRQKKAEGGFVTLEYARCHRDNTTPGGTVTPTPKHPGRHIIKDITVADLAERFDWQLFDHIYGVNRTQSKNTPEQREEEREKLHTEAQACLDKIASDGAVQPCAVVGIFPAKRLDNDDIEVLFDYSKNPAVFHCLRQVQKKEQAETSKRETYCSLCDYVDGWIGLFAVTVGGELHTEAERLRKNGEVESATMVHALSLVLAECLSSAVHERARTTLWDTGGVPCIRPAFGYPSAPDHTEKLTAWDALGVEDTCGIRLTDSCMMVPEASCSGFILCAPNAHYFTLGVLSQEQRDDYVARKHKTARFRNMDAGNFTPTPF